MNPTEPSSYEMHKDAMNKFRDRAERAEAELERVKKVCAEMREALERIAGGMPRGLHLTEAMAMEAFAEKALARAKEAGL